MTRCTWRTRRLAVVSAVALTAGLLTATGGATSPAVADDAPAVSYVVEGTTGPVNPEVTAGVQIRVTATGFAPSVPVMIGQCGGYGIPQSPGDCAPAARLGSLLVQSDEVGTVTGTLVAIVGPMHNARPPAVTCTAFRLCDVVALNIIDQSQVATTRLVISPDLVIPDVDVVVSKQVVRKGRPVTFRGVIGPNQALRQVRLQRKVGKEWRTKKRTRLTMTSDYAVTVRPRAKKVRFWRVVLPATSYSAAARSDRQKVRVKAPKRKQ